jgi:hypothetical protein
MSGRETMAVISLGFIAAATILECRGYNPADQVLLAAIFGMLAFFR